MIDLEFSDTFVVPQDPGRNQRVEAIREDFNYFLYKDKGKYSL